LGVRLLGNISKSILVLLLEPEESMLAAMNRVSTASVNIVFEPGHLVVLFALRHLVAAGSVSCYPRSGVSLPRGLPSPRQVGQLLARN